MSLDPPRPVLSDETARRFGALALLDRLMVTPDAFHAALLEGDDSFLEPLFDLLLAEDLAAVDGDDYFRPTPKGRRAYQRMLHLQQSYLAHFDIFAAVDLGAGTFADPERDYLDDPRWADLRVAVAEFKRIDPYRLVFLSMLAGGRFFESPGWKFDIALGSSFFQELDEVVETQLDLPALGYSAEDGAEVSGEAVLEDVILQGARINQERLRQERIRRAAQPVHAAPDEGVSLAAGLAGDLPEIPPVPYDPEAPAAAYASSVRFAEPIWLEADW